MVRECSELGCRSGSRQERGRMSKAARNDFSQPPRKGQLPAVLSSAKVPHGVPKYLPRVNSKTGGGVAPPRSPEIGNNCRGMVVREYHHNPAVGALELKEQRVSLIVKEHCT